MGVDLEYWKPKLLGRKMLTTISTSILNPKLGSGDDDEAVAIELDGETFLFLEDGNDGYRSSLGFIFHSPGGFYASTYPRRLVDITFVTEGDDYTSPAEVFEFRDVETGKLALAIGTSNIDDYYPSFICRYDPTAFGEKA